MSIFTSIVAMAQHVVNCDFTSQTNNITNSTEWSNSLYRVEGCIHVTNGNTLTIDAGVIVMFEKSVSAALIIDKGAKLVVNGTSMSPVIFTSDQTPGNKAYGDWEGLIIEGQASNNVSGGSISLSGRSSCSSISGGGSTDGDNSGTIEYLRIEYANYGITFLSVGSGTTVDHIQTSYIANNAFEFYGGTVDAKNLISYNAKGDDLMFTDGNRSLIQFAVSVRLDVSNAHLSSGSNAVVITNDATGSSNTPFTHPVVSDMTIIGPLYCGATSISADYKNAVLYDENAHGGLYNGFITGWPTGFLINDASSINNSNTTPAASTLNFSDNSFTSNTTDYTSGTTWPSGGCATSMSSWIMNGGLSSCSQMHNQFPTFTTGLSSTICGTYSTTPPSFQLSTTSLKGSDYTDASDLSNAFFNTSTRKHGGFTTSSGSDWTTTWTNWNPQAFNPCTEGRMSNPTSVNNIAAGNITGLQLAPNPSSGTTYANFNVLADGNVTISVVDNAGRVLRTTQSNVAKGNQHIAVDTKGLATGIYIIKVQSSNSLMHAQLVVE